MQAHLSVLKHSFIPERDQSRLCLRSVEAFLWKHLTFLVFFYKGRFSVKFLNLISRLLTPSKLIPVLISLTQVRCRTSTKMAAAVLQVDNPSLLSRAPCFSSCVQIRGRENSEIKGEHHKIKPESALCPDGSVEGVDRNSIEQRGARVWSALPSARRDGQPLARVLVMWTKRKGQIWKILGKGFRMSRDKPSQ